MTRVAAIAALLGATAVDPRVSAQPPSPPASLGRAAIAGRVTDSFGDSAVSVIVTVESRGENGATRGAGLAETDDRGEYRIGRLPAGAAIVRGRVVTTAGSAVPRAQVRLLPADITQTRAAAADADGRFEFRDVAPGAFRLIAGKPGYESVDAAPAIEVKPEETRDGVELRLVRWSTMSGIVTGDRGEPVAGARVQLLRLGYDGGRRRLL